MHAGCSCLSSLITNLRTGKPATQERSCAVFARSVARGRWCSLAMEDPLTGAQGLTFSLRPVACGISADAAPCAAADFPRRNADEEEERERARAWAERPPALPALQVALLLLSNSGLLINLRGSDRCVRAVA